MLATLAEFISAITRPTITIILTTTVCYLAIRSNISVTGEQLLNILAVVVGFWFGTRQLEKALNAVTSNNSIDNRNPPGSGGNGPAA